MKERPILFSGPMVRAILDGRKTVTRRVVKPQPQRVGTYTRDGQEVDWVELDEDGDPVDSELRCPYGMPGDRLWVRETWGVDHLSMAAGIPKATPEWLPDEGVLYRADGDCCEQIPECQCADTTFPLWRPSIHMPRWASRILLEVVSVRVERLQEITVEDAAREGVSLRSECSVGDNFRALWDEINAGRGFAWASNPWVWRVEFRRIEAP